MSDRLNLNLEWSHANNATSIDKSDNCLTTRVIKRNREVERAISSLTT
jgi:hypothetical protein